VTTALVVGGGGREHTLAWALGRSGTVDHVLVAPGNAGTDLDQRCQNVEVAATDVDGLVELARAESVDLVVVGPEDPLVAGIVDRMDQAGIAAFGPGATASRLEGSKAFCKQFLHRHSIPTGEAKVFDDADDALAFLEELEQPPVVKASGLAAGKGVIVAESHADAAAAVRSILVDRRFGAAGDQVLLEERLVGTEVSVLAFCDGVTFRLMPAAQDHKRLLDGDRGPNTGGMGAFVPSPIADESLLEQIGEEVIAPTLGGVAEEGSSYRGVLYAGMMLTDSGPKVLEYNCRFGDPETQVVLPLLESDLAEILSACTEGRLDDIEIAWREEAAVTVVMASKGYPEHSSEPVVVHGLNAAADLGCTVFHAGTVLSDGEVMAVGGRVLAVTAVAPDVAAAAEWAHSGVAAIDFAGSQHRRDIARAASGSTP
jgi:phosphoribosylamine--glycine ligase